MGLDQYAGLRDSKGEVHEKFYWRKHARLQVFMSKQFNKQKKDASKEFLPQKQLGYWIAYKDNSKKSYKNKDSLGFNKSPTKILNLHILLLHIPSHFHILLRHHRNNTLHHHDFA